MDNSLILLSPRFREIARRLLLGEKQIDIAKEMGMSAHALSTIINRNPMFRQAMAELSELADTEAFDLLKYMRGHTKEAAEKIVGTMRDPDATRGEQYKAAKDILGFGGHRNAVSGTNVNVVSFEQRLHGVEPSALDAPEDILEIRDMNDPDFDDSIQSLENEQ